MLWEVNVHHKDASGDHTARAVVAGAAAVGVDACRQAATATGWLIEGELSRADVEQLAATLLTDPVTESFTVAEVGDAAAATGHDHLPTVLHVLPRTGVTDPAALTAHQSLALLGLRPT
ncbi:MAG: hypothetical protein O3A37_10460, partial [Planctomycetota bacterium]|nr:hypothetical protein [Planctomycetota bacterium]